jgi:hypothetical protein
MNKSKDLEPMLIFVYLKLYKQSYLIMKKYRIQALWIASSLLILTSCQKELSFETQPPTSNPALLGVWALASMEVDVHYDLAITDGVDTSRTLTNAHYFSKNNIGLLTIGETSMSFSHYSYSIDTTITAEYFFNGVSGGSFELPFEFDSPSVDSEIPEYRLIGEDSIYFPLGSILSMEAGIIGNPSEPSGLRYKVEGDRLTLITNVDYYGEEIDQDGFKTIRKVYGRQIAILQKP